MKRTYTKQLSAFSIKVKAVRISKKITQVELAAKMDADVRTVKRIESKNCNPRLETILSVADALGINVKDLL